MRLYLVRKDLCCTSCLVINLKNLITSVLVFLSTSKVFIYIRLFVGARVFQIFVHCYVLLLVIVFPQIFHSRQGSNSTGKTGRMVKSNSRQGKHREFENFGKTQGKHREFENFLIESRNQESMPRKNCCVTLMVLFLMFQILSFY